MLGAFVLFSFFPLICSNKRLFSLPPHLAGFDFQLITLLCVDEFGAGFPVAYCITNRVDKTAMLTFFKAVKEKTGAITPEVFMSDDAQAFYNAWQEVMGDAKRRLLCAWHVDKNWRESIKKHVPDKQLQAFTYKVFKSFYYASLNVGAMFLFANKKLEPSCPTEVDGQQSCWKCNAI